jgi:hypothetical protein
MSFLHFLQHLFSPFFSFENFGIEVLESRDSWLGALDKLSLKKKSGRRRGEGGIPAFFWLALYSQKREIENKRAKIKWLTYCF